MVNKKPIILLLLAVAIIAFPLVLYNGQGADYFAGADEKGSASIEETGYQPWFNSIWEPPNGEIESMLFALQAAIGAIIVGFILGYYKGQADERKRKEKSPKIIENIKEGEEPDNNK